MSMVSMKQHMLGLSHSKINVTVGSTQEVANLLQGLHAICDTFLQSSGQVCFASPMLFCCHKATHHKDGPKEEWSKEKFKVPLTLKSNVKVSI